MPFGRLYHHIATLAMALCFIAASAEAQTIAKLELPALLKDAPTDARWHKDGDFVAATFRARKKLAGMQAGYTTQDIVTVVKHKKKPARAKVIGKKITDFNILLEVKYRDDTATKTVTINKDGNNSDGYVVDFKKLNGLNTNFIVSHPPGYMVLAIKRVIRQGKRGFREEVYTPYSAELDTPLMRARGLAYLTAMLDKGYQDLTTRSVMSAASPGHSLTEIVPLDVSFMLSLIEHIDPTRAQREPIEKLVNEVLVTVAANGPLSYAYAVSKAGARGLFQFIPRTYASIKKQYPGAGLDKNFAHGMNNHVNGAKASLLLFDADLRQLKADKREELLKDKRALAEYLAIAYNSGARRAVRAHLSGSQAHLPKETALYVLKLKKVTQAFAKK